MTGRAADPASATWFDDETAIEHELRRGFAAARGGLSIPGYVDLREIGRGGQATVFAAVQRSTGRQVAVKSFHDRPGQAAPMLRRFERELELVTALRHPSIVTLFDGGIDDQGRPFLVMELVDGVPIDAAPAVQRLRRDGPTDAAIAAVVELFVAVVEAVAFAHLQGVLHRDLKPGNILVDRDGMPRVLDFGLARVITGGVLAASSQSLDAGFVGTLAYASPEQARGDTVDLRSDVWSLGVILYQLLSGSLPFELPGDLRGALAVLAEPGVRPLSSVVPALPADLGAIVAHCLSIAPERRYQGAAELLADLRRCLAREPIAARADSAWYLVRRRLRKWRFALLASAAAIVGLGVTLWITTAALGRAETAQRRQQREAARLQRTLDWLVQMVSAVDPDVDGEDARLYAVLARTAPDLDEAFAQDVESRTQLRATLAEVFEKLGRWQEAGQQAERLLADLEGWRGAGHADTLRGRLAVLRLRFLRERTADLTAPIVALQASCGREVGEWHPTTIATRQLLADSLRARHQLDAAETIWRDLLAAEAAPFDRAARAKIRAELAAIASMRGQPQAALAGQREVVAELDAALGPGHRDSLAAHSDLAHYLVRLDLLDEAETVLSTLRERVVAKYGESHPRSLTVSEHLALVVQDRGRPQAAVPLLQRILQLRAERLGAGHRDTLGTRNNLAVAQGLSGDLAGALVTQGELVATLAAIETPDAFDLANAHCNQATILMRLGRPQDALPAYREAVAIAQRSLGEDSGDTATFRMLLGGCLVRLGEFAEAEPLLLEALARLERTFGATHPRTLKARANLHELYVGWRRPDDAARYGPR